MQSMETDPYDRLPYTDHAYAESHPNRLAVVARLSGWHPPELEQARILEIGCARGGNLLPMATSLPRAALVGIDRSAGQVDDASRIVEATGLANVTVRCTGFETADFPPASFDFVICHGLYSWIPMAARRALLRGIGRWLAPSGVAYVSFNTLPGWYDRLAAKDWLRRSRAPGDDDPEGKTALASLAWLTEQISPELLPYRRRLEQVLGRLQETDPAYLVHEYLSEEHHPEHVETFLGEAADSGLAYLGDAIPSNTALELLPADVAVRVRDLDVSATQRTVDFVQCTSFRRALLVRADTCGARGWQFPQQLDPEALGSLRIASRLRAEANDFFRGAQGSVQVFDPAARAALLELERAAPRSRAFRELPGSGSALASELFDLWLATGELDLYAFEPRMRSRADGAPKAPALVRWQAENARPITNLWHQEVRLPDSLVRRVLAHLDGTHSFEALERDAGEAGLLGHASPADRRTLIRASVDLLAASALLVDG